MDPPDHGPGERPTALGFPPGTLGERAWRLPVLAQGADWLALEKPPQIGLRAHPWDVGTPNLDEALNAQLERGKPELLRTGASVFASTYYMDPCISGIALLATSPSGTERLRNAFGSGRLRFRFVFVSRDNGTGDTEYEERAPLLPHRSVEKMVPSSAKGKRAKTRFKRLAVASSGWTVWSATTSHLRPHQVRLHAFLAGIPVMGDAVYRGPRTPLLADLKRGARGEGAQNPVFDGPSIRLQQLSMPDEAVELNADDSGPWKSLLRKLGLRVGLLRGSEQAAGDKGSIR